VNKILKISLVSLILFSSSSFADQMRIYGFTNDFVSCVKARNEQSENYTLHGSADSGLLNGQGIIDSGNLDGTYWNYMNCLSKSRGGTKNENLTQSTPCTGALREKDGTTFYLPPALDGKVAGVDGFFFKCSNGSWSSVDPVVKIPSGGSRDITPPGSSSCSSETKSFSGCTFELGSSKHGHTVEDFFGQKYDASEKGFEGYVKAVCRNGTHEIVSNSCLPTTCQSGETVSWFGKDVYGRSGICSGTVNSEGFALNTKSDTKYYSSMSEARLRSIVIKQNSYSQSICTNGHWEITADSECKIKTAEEMECQSVGSDFNKRYFCK
jgi:hypothetical protein